ncbi:hypothetical protein BK128_09570 [Viridibacillus sp. FSL H7-0596]|uniref:hypothetical protein n=1 Tax=Viridibacillus sp. FSL H7-0596 TaxID=1928923 RepID=UPI00096F73A3|nr:hypothetical protein [Viridibacillus sp. FSL H7-0596]OMC86904.1 hypothetical protein BK128_09570 [Viridibacillus sp. FSL H7-0596]
MNMKRNGILVDNPAARVKRTKVNHRKQQPTKQYTQYVEMKSRYNDFATVVTPDIPEYIAQLKSEGYYVAMTFPVRDWHKEYQEQIS